MAQSHALAGERTIAMRVGIDGACWLNRRGSGRLPAPWLYAALQRVLGAAELRRRLQRLGPERAATFSWERAARETLSAFHALAHPQQAPYPSGSTLPEKETTA